MFARLCEAYAGDERLLLASMDGVANELRPEVGVVVRAFPSLFFFPAGSKGAPMEYTGERSVDAMTRFIEQHRDTRSALDELDELDDAGEGEQECAEEESGSGDTAQTSCLA